MWLDDCLVGLGAEIKAALSFTDSSYIKRGGIFTASVRSSNRDTVTIMRGTTMHSPE